MENINLNFTKYLFLLLILMAGCQADLRTKSWASKNLKNQHGISIIPEFFELHYVENDAIAFSLLHSLDKKIRLPLIFTLSIGATVILLFLLWMWRHHSFKELFPLMLVLGGALGNITDRFMNHYVIDFICFHYKNRFDLPIFNVADILVFCGISLLIYNYWKGAYHFPPRQQNDVNLSPE